MRGIVTGLALGLALAGCAGGGYNFGVARGGGGGLPEVAMQASRDVVVPPGRDVQMGLALRTFVPKAEGGWNEVRGVRCRVTGGDYFAADVVTPVRLILPDLGPDAPPLQADCDNGTARGATVVRPAFGWPAAGRPWAGERVWWGGGWWWGFQKTGPMRYPDLAVALH